MANAVVMPKAGISVESCIIGQWRVKVGDTVKLGDILFDYETDKASFECESTEEGTILEILFEDGEEVPVLEAVCLIGYAGENPVHPPSVQTHPSTASPRAKKLAEKLNIDPSTVTPTGPKNRVIERDVQMARIEKPVTIIPEKAAETPNSKLQTPHSKLHTPHFTDEKFTQIRKVISAGMLKSLSEMAQLTHHHSYDAANILEFRKICKDAGEKITLNDVILYAVSRTLKTHGGLNAHLINGDTIRKFSAVNLGVAMDTPRGLMVPTLFDADKKSLAEISTEVKKLNEMALSGNISPDLMQSATFTVSNLGQTGVEMFTPIINPPQVAILGVCGINTNQRMGLSLTYDHRAVDGAPASRFAADLCRNLENFILLLIKG